MPAAVVTVAQGARDAGPAGARLHEAQGLGYWRLKARLGEGNEMNLKSHPPPPFYRGAGKPNSHWTVSL